MKLFIAEGRLGNQIFQYAFLKTIRRKNETIIVSGFEDLKEVFKANDYFNLNKKNKWIKKFLSIIVKPILNFLSSKKIISSIQVNYEKILDKYERETTTYTIEKGIFNFVTFVKLGFFQSELFFDKKILKCLSIKDNYIDNAETFLKIIPKNSYKIFIHIRRSDYKNFFVYGKNTLLPISYYKKQINYFIKKQINCFFIFLSDNPDFVKKEFNDIDNKLISYNAHFGTDLAIMTKCQSAILSPSSFGWWGAYLMAERDIVFAPNNWLGFMSKLEYQSSCVAKFMNRIEIQ